MSTTSPSSPYSINVAIDLDGVLTEHPRPLAIAANAQFGMDLPESAFIDSAGLNVPMAVRDWVYGVDGPASLLMPSPDAQEFIARIIELLGMDRVRILTARPESSVGMTRTWLRRHGFPEIAILFSDDKAEVAAAERCTFAVEDSVRHAVNYAKSGITSLLILTDSTPPFDAHERIWTVQSLMSIIYRLDELKRENERLAALAEAGLPRIVIADQIDAAARAYLASAAELVDVDGTNLPALLSVLPDADALVVRSETQVTEQVLTAAPKLRVVARAGVGVDNVDLEAATRRGVLVLNAPGANRISAGEHTIALLLAVTRQINIADSVTRAGGWPRKRIRPIDLAGKTVGIVGLGRVGSVVAARLKAFEMTVLASDPYIQPERFAELGVERVDYLDLLTRSDVVTYHCPSTDETRHMLDAKRIALMRPDAIVINASRGDVVDQDALAEAVASGHLRGAGVDVFPFEPCTESPLFGLPNVVLTPHTGGSSAEALAHVGEMISTTTLAALAGQAVPNAVNLPPASLLAPDLQRLTSVAAAAGHLLTVVQPELPTTFRVTVRGIVPVDVIEHVMTSALSDAINRWTGRWTTPVNARIVANELGIKLATLTGANDPEVEPSFSFEVLGETSHHVRVMWDRKSAGIVEVDRFALDRALAGDLLITHHRDVPGIVGRVGTIMGLYKVNIAGMQVGRHHRGGEALMVLNVDDEIPQAALDEIKTIPGVETAYRVSLPRAQPRLATVAMSTSVAK
jgi:D-3-phosphoglycerate dehydrogenase / 2-oxoglutarate reductase